VFAGSSRAAAPRRILAELWIDPRVSLVRHAGIHFLRIDALVGEAGHGAPTPLGGAGPPRPLGRLQADVELALSLGFVDAELLVFPRGDAAGRRHEDEGRGEKRQPERHRAAHHSPGPSLTSNAEAPAAPAAARAAGIRGRAQVAWCAGDIVPPALGR